MKIPSLTPLATRVVALVVLGGIAATAGAVLWRHYSGLVDDKATLTAKAATLEADLAGERARSAGLAQAIDTWEKAAAAQQLALDTWGRVQSQAAAQSRETRNVLTKHDLGALAKAKPGLVERRINAGTERALRLLESASKEPASAGAAEEPAAGGPAGPVATRP